MRKPEAVWRTVFVQGDIHSGNWETNMFWWLYIYRTVGWGQATRALQPVLLL